VRCVDDGSCPTRASESGNTCAVLLIANEHDTAKPLKPGEHGTRNTPGIRSSAALEAATAAAKAGTPPPPPDRPPPLSGVPWDVAQDAMAPEALVIVVGVAGALANHAQDEKPR
jgi:hypothetical protein